ncbi:MAG: TlyA family RNA methyltransferase [Rickettsiales bacterium]|nr:TlyA family RNA methyltransferase [Rickettsiales bacterium]
MRLDIYLFQNKFYESRARAAAAIESGLVLVNKKIAVKAGQIVCENDQITTRPLPYKSGRGALKLAHAMDAFNINPDGWVCLDVGASTGGFTEVLLNRGAARVFAVDVGTSQLNSELKNDHRVVSLENVDIRALPPIAPVDLIVIDVSFISVGDIADAVAKWNANKIIVLIKPQFEVPRRIAAKSDGVIRDEKYHNDAINGVVSVMERVGYAAHDVIKSPILGGSGNTEFLGYFIRK